MGKQLFESTVMQDKAPERSSEEGCFSKKKLEKDAPEPAPPRFKRGGLEGGGSILSWGMLLLLVGFAAPLLVIFLIKSPQPGDRLLIFGISYYKLLYVLFLTAAIMVHTSLFLLRTRPVFILIFFILALFCCVPFVVGLKTDLTLDQVILDIPFFDGWPFFLNPAYVLIEFVIPMGLLIYLFLQIKGIFSRKTHSHAFLYAALYLLVAAILGLSGLHDAGQPNIGVVFAQAKDYFTDSHPKTLSGQESFQAPIPERDNPPQPEGLLKFPIPNLMEDSVDPPKAVVEETVTSTQVTQLAEKISSLETELKGIKELVTSKDGADPVEPIEKVAGAIDADAARPVEEAPTMGRVQAEIRRLSEDVRAISDALKKMALVLPSTAETPEKKKGSAEKDVKRALQANEMHP